MDRAYIVPRAAGMKLAAKVPQYHETTLEAGPYKIAFETGSPGSKRGVTIAEENPEAEEAVKILRATALTNRLFAQAVKTPTATQAIELWHAVQRAQDAKADGIPYEHGDGFKIFNDSRDKRIAHAVAAVVNMHAGGDAEVTLEHAHNAADLSPVDARRVAQQLRTEKITLYKAALAAADPADTEPTAIADCAALLQAWGGAEMCKTVAKNPKVVALIQHFKPEWEQAQARAAENVKTALRHAA